MNISSGNFADLIAYGDLRKDQKMEVADNRRSRSTCDSQEIGRSRLEINNTQRASGESRQSGSRASVASQQRKLSRLIRISEEPDLLAVASACAEEQADDADNEQIKSSYSLNC